VTLKVPLCHKEYVLARPRPHRSVKPLILCIEDNERYLWLRKKVLERNGFDVVCATTGDGALEILAEAPVCLTLSDHMLRGTTGVQLAKRMKAVKPEVPVVIYSGRVPETMQNVDAFINKDEPTEEFVKLLRDLVRRYCGLGGRARAT